MKGMCYTKEVLTKSIQALISEREIYKEKNDVYCALVKQMMLSASGLN